MPYVVTESLIESFKAGLLGLYNGAFGLII
jgi:hypothetical protein